MEFTWQDVIDIAIVASLIYWIIILIKGTRAAQMFFGLVLIFIAYITASVLGLKTIYWILSNFLNSIILVIIVIFQADIRRALTTVGNPFLKGYNFGGREDIFDEIVKASGYLANHKIGAIIALERETGLKNYMEFGIPLDFNPVSPLHDGAVIVQQGIIAAAGCFLPLSSNPQISKELGSRHRAALGLSEETDAVIIVISEERGTISIALNGNLIQKITSHELKQHLMALFKKKEEGLLLKLMRRI
ncbi:MAG: TIGR00159 family protein [Deltaproteobacteria bacterium]|nr:TIGR00159 family protein [Deltaproteobacteria bacterium]